MSYMKRLWEEQWEQRSPEEKAQAVERAILQNLPAEFRMAGVPEDVDLEFLLKRSLQIAKERNPDAA